MTPLRQQGLTLIEVMIALAVFSFGLLALAAEGQPLLNVSGDQIAAQGIPSRVRM